MKVTAVLLGLHRVFLPAEAQHEGRVTLDYDEEPVTLACVMHDLGMPADTPRIVFLRGEAIREDHELLDGDEVTFVSPLGGG